MSDVHPFAYRVPRFPLKLPVEFHVQDGPISGYTLDLSDAGLYARFSEPVLPGTVGRICLRLNTCSIEIAAEVAYTELFEAGLRFRFSCSDEQLFIKTLVKLVSRQTSVRKVAHAGASASHEAV